MSPDTIPDSLNEREFEIINIIGAELGSNQRDLSRLMDLSLGMVNMLLRRLVSKGYIRIQQLNKRKVEYILTPKGFAEKMRKSIQYTLKTIHSISVIKNNLQDVLSNIVQKGERDFIILGESDFALLVEMVLRDLCANECSIKHIKEMPAEINDSYLIISKEDGHLADLFFKDRYINLIEELARQHTFSVPGGDERI